MPEPLCVILESVLSNLCSTTHRIRPEDELGKAVGSALRTDTAVEEAFGQMQTWTRKHSSLAAFRLLMAALQHNAELALRLQVHTNCLSAA